MKELEFEARQVISKEDYQRIMNFYSIEKFPNHKITSQKNYYFDNDKLEITSTGSVLRLRVFIKPLKKSEFTFKVATSKDKGDEEFTQHLSAEEEINLVEKHILPNGEVIESLKSAKINLTKINYVGSIQTERFEVYEKGYTIVIDANKYSGVEDFNIEIESTSKELANKKLSEILNAFNIPFMPGGPSKSSRAIKEYLKRKEN